MTRDASCVTLPTDGTSLITLPMPDAASPASTRCDAHESAQAQSEFARHIAGDENVDARERMKYILRIEMSFGLPTVYHQEQDSSGLNQKNCGFNRQGKVVPRLTSRVHWNA
jgi:hypothetical protein